MTRVRDTIILSKLGTTDPVALEWNITPTAGMAVVLCGAVDSNTHTYDIPGFTRLDVGDTGSAGGSATVWYVETGADTITELTFTWTSSAIITAMLIDGHDTTTLIDASVGSGYATGSNEYYTEQITTVSNGSICVELLAMDGSGKQLSYFGPEERTVVQSGSTLTTTSVQNVTVYSYLPVAGGTYGNELIRTVGNDGGGIITFAIKDATPSTPTVPIYKTQNDVVRVRDDIFDARGTVTNPRDYIEEHLYDRALESDIVFDGSLIAANVVTTTAHGWADDYAFIYMGGSLTDIPELTVGEAYRIDEVTTNTFVIKIIGGSVTLTITPTAGNHTLKNVGIHGDFAFKGITVADGRAPDVAHVVGGGVFPSVDLSGKNLLFSISSLANDDHKKTVDYGLMLVLQSAGGWRSYTVGGRDMPISTDSEYYVVINPSVATEVKEVGTFDSTAVTSVWFGNRRALSSFSPSTNYSSVAEANELVVVGGTAALPITLSNVAKQSSLVTVDNDNYATLQCPVQIGNGSQETHYIDPLMGISSVPPSDGITDARFYVADDYFSFAFNTSADDVINAGKTVICSDYLETGVEPAYYNFDNKAVQAYNSCEIAGWQVSSGRVFSNCSRVELNDATLTGATFKDSLDTAGAVLLTTTHNLVTPTFNGNEYHIEIDTAGDYDISDHTYLNAGTKDINITATSGIVNLAVGATQPTPTYDTAGATVNLVAPVTSTQILVPGIIDGAFVIPFIDGVALTEFTVSGGSGIDLSYVSGVDYAAGDSWELWIAYVDGVTAKQELSIKGQFGAVNTVDTRIEVLEDCPVYIENGVDGSLVTGYTHDAVNDEVDITVTPDWSMLELFAWIKYKASSGREAMLDFFEELMAEDTGNYYFADNRLTLRLDNPTNIRAKETSGVRLYTKTGDGDPIKDPTTGNAGIDVNWREKVYTSVVSTASPVITGDIADVPDYVWNEPIAGHLNVGSTGEALDAASQGGAGGGATAQEVWEYTTRGLTEEVTTDAASQAGSQADVSSLSTQASVDALNDLSLAEIESSPFLAKEATVSTRASQASVTALGAPLQVSQYTAPDNVSITKILTDTNELQQNQGNWVTATGFVTKPELDAAEANIVDSVPTPTDNADAVRTELTPELTKIDDTYTRQDTLNTGIQKASISVPHSEDLP